MKVMAANSEMPASREVGCLLLVSAKADTVGIGDSLVDIGLPGYGTVLPAGFKTQSQTEGFHEPPVWLRSDSCCQGMVLLPTRGTQE